MSEKTIAVQSPEWVHPTPRVEREKEREKEREGERERKKERERERERKKERDRDRDLTSPNGHHGCWHRQPRVFCIRIYLICVHLMYLLNDQRPPHWLLAPGKPGGLFNKVPSQICPDSRMTLSELCRDAFSNVAIPTQPK
jgi:hypothetical protein